MDEVIKKVSEMPSNRKGYIDGIRYYYDIIMKTPGLSEEEDLYRALVSFGVELEELVKYEDSTSVLNLSEIFEKFYPNGEIHHILNINNLSTPLDGISECLYRLKKDYNLTKWG